MNTLLRYGAYYGVVIALLLCSHTTARAPLVHTASAHHGQSIQLQQWYLRHIGLPSQPLRSRVPVTIALIDTGIDQTAPQLRANISAVVNIVAPDALRDLDGHATHSAALIAAAPDANGMQSVCPVCKLLVIKAISDHGYGSDVTVAEAIEIATARHVDVINLSIGGAVTSPRLRRAVAAAIAADIVVVAAAGNTGTHQTQRLFPAGYPGVIGVGASTRFDTVAAFSAAGADTDITAPGVDIISISAGTHYRITSGTSSAASFVSAAAGVLRSAFPAASAATIRRALIRGARDIDSPGPDARSGAGVLDIAAAARILIADASAVSAR